MKVSTVWSHRCRSSTGTFGRWVATCDVLKVAGLRAWIVPGVLVPGDLRRRAAVHSASMRTFPVGSAQCTRGHAARPAPASDPAPHP